MTLRLRLVLALVLLVAAGLAVYGVVTYSVYSRSEYNRLDAQIRSSQPLVQRRLQGDNGPGGPADGGGGGGPQVNIPAGTFAELLDASGTVVNSLNLSNGNAEPKLPSPLPDTDSSKLFTVGSTTGSGGFRVMVSRSPGPGGGLGNPFGSGRNNTNYTLVIAAPLTDVNNALH